MDETLQCPSLIDTLGFLQFPNLENIQFTDDEVKSIVSDLQNTLITFQNNELSDDKTSQNTQSGGSSYVLKKSKNSLKSSNSIFTKTSKAKSPKAKSSKAKSPKAKSSKDKSPKAKSSKAKSSKIKKTSTENKTTKKRKVSKKRNVSKKRKSPQKRNSEMTSKILYKHKL